MRFDATGYRALARAPSLRLFHAPTGDIVQLRRFELAGWFADRYDPAARGPMVRNLSEDEQYDALFPEHPLTRVHALLGHVERTLEVEPKVRAAAPYAYLA
ncbi:MAG: hypothetical protein K8W52_30710 [Deltaproteobacteria bacterium]|nr:hypothetical protein [Deltaproteobacteria bacterium]